MMLVVACSPDATQPAPPSQTDGPDVAAESADGSQASQAVESLQDPVRETQSQDSCSAEDPGCEESSTAPTNILYVSIDTFRRDRISRFNGRDTTPWLDGFLDTAVVLENHRSCSNWTFASMACAFAGSYNTDQGYMPIANVENELPGSIDTMAEILGRVGFATSLVSATRLSESYMALFRG
jgi:membrane-anchored protein YejM (alkaline phosphatase superfamily)